MAPEDPNGRKCRKDSTTESPKTVPKAEVSRLCHEAALAVVRMSMESGASVSRAFEVLRTTEAQYASLGRRTVLGCAKDIKDHHELAAVAQVSGFVPAPLGPAEAPTELPAEMSARSLRDQKKQWIEDAVSLWSRKRARQGRAEASAIS